MVHYRFELLVMRNTFVLTAQAVVANSSTCRFRYIFHVPPEGLRVVLSDHGCKYATERTKTPSIRILKHIRSTVRTDN